MPFLRAVDLSPASQPPASGTSSRFTATTQYVPWPKSYGGDLLAQAAAAGMRSVGADRRLHAMHSLFVAPADVLRTVEYDVQPLRDGRSYSTRDVKGRQDGEVVLASLLSFHVGEPSPVVDAPMPQVTPPESLPSAADAVASARREEHRIPDAAADYWSASGEGGRSFDIRHVETPVYSGHAGATSAGERPLVSHVWIRPFAALPDEPAMHDLALIYVCDYTILEPVLRSQGKTWTDPGLTTASLDHSIWLHERAPVGDWVLSTQTVESYRDGRGLVRGTMHSRDGRHLASTVQQGLIRIRGAAGKEPT